MPELYTEAQELKDIAQKLKARYFNVIGHVEIDKIFFAFKGGDNVSEYFKYELLGSKNEWTKYVNEIREHKSYCLAMSYDFFQNSGPALLEWTILDLLYGCHEYMNGDIKKKEIHEYSRIISTLEDLGFSCDWRTLQNLPPLLDHETISFQLEDYDAL